MVNEIVPENKIKYDAVNMKVTNHPELDAYIKEPVRKGWEYGENLQSAH